MADRFCGECGNELRPSDKFCPGCGRPVRGEEAARPASPTTEQEPEGLPFIADSTVLAGHGDTSVGIHAGGVEFYKSELRGRSVDSLGFDQITRVRAEMGYLFATLVIETAGGKELVSRGLWKSQARRAAELIRERIQI